MVDDLEDSVLKGLFLFPQRILYRGDFLDNNTTEFFIGGTKVKIVNPKDEPNRDEVEKILSSIALLYRNTLKNSEHRKDKQG